jgi:hypothetical protein
MALDIKRCVTRRKIPHMKSILKGKKAVLL